MTETMNAFPGINAETLTGFAAYAAENPSEVVLGAEAKAIWTGHAGHTTAKIGPWSLAGARIEKESRDYTMQFGAWKEVEEASGVDTVGDKLEPVEAALAAMCACVTWAICLNAAREGITFDSMVVSANADINPILLLGEGDISDSESLIKSVDLNVDVKGENLTAEDSARIKAMTNRSPVHSLITYSNPMATTVTVS